MAIGPELANATWLLLGLSALFLAPALSLVFGVRARLEIGRSGFVVRQGFHRRRYRWRDTGWFRTTYIPGTRYRLGYRTVKFDGRHENSDYEVWTSITLPHYRMPADKLADIMNAYRERAAGPPGD